jgi:hypothetical protein
VQCCNVIITVLIISDHDALLFTMYMPTTVEECKNPIQSDQPTSRFKTTETRPLRRSSKPIKFVFIFICYISVRLQSKLPQPTTETQENGNDIKIDRELTDNEKQPMENSFIQPSNCKLGLLEQLRIHRKETSNTELKKLQQLLAEQKKNIQKNKNNKRTKPTQNKTTKKQKVSTNMFNNIPTQTLSKYDKIRQNNIIEKNQAYAVLTADKASLEATHFKEWVLKYIHSVKQNKPITMFELDDLIEFLHNNQAPYTQVIKLIICIHFIFTCF